MTAVSNWRSRYSAEVRQSVLAAERYNTNQKWLTRPMTKEEYEEAFGEKPESCHRLKVKNMNNEATMTILIDDISKVKRLTNIAMSLPFYVDAVSDRWRIDAKSLMALLSLDVSKPIELRFLADNEDRARFAFSEFEVK